jgi:hypothetical protein
MRVTTVIDSLSSQNVSLRWFYDFLATIDPLPPDERRPDQGSISAKRSGFYAASK